MILTLRLKIVLLLPLISFGGKLLGQENKLNDSIIYIQEVAIETNKKSKVAKATTLGTHKEIRGFNKADSKYVSLVRNIPKGQLVSICFFFSPGMLNKNSEFDLGLLMFELDENGKPGRALSDKETKFKLKANGKGKIKLDLRKLYLNSKEELFFGFAIYNDITRNPLLVKFSIAKGATSFYQELKSDWLSPVGDPVQLQLVVEIDPDN